MKTKAVNKVIGKFKLQIILRSMKIEEVIDLHSYQNMEVFRKLQYIADYSVW